MESLTPDLRALVQAGRINFHQAREMMFVPPAAGGDGAPSPSATPAAGASAKPRRCVFAPLLLLLLSPSFSPRPDSFPSSHFFLDRAPSSPRSLAVICHVI